MPAVHPSFLESMDPTLAVEGKKPSGQSLSTGCPQPPNFTGLKMKVTVPTKTLHMLNAEVVLMTALSPCFTKVMRSINMQGLVGTVT